MATVGCKCSAAEEAGVITGPLIINSPCDVSIDSRSPRRRAAAAGKSACVCDLPCPNASTAPDGCLAAVSVNASEFLSTTFCSAWCSAVAYLLLTRCMCCSATRTPSSGEAAGAGCEQSHVRGLRQVQLLLVHGSRAAHTRRKLAKNDMRMDVETKGGADTNCGIKPPKRLPTLQARTGATACDTINPMPSGSLVGSVGLGTQIWRNTSMRMCGFQSTKGNEEAIPGAEEALQTLVSLLVLLKRESNLALVPARSIL